MLPMPTAAELLPLMPEIVLALGAFALLMLDLLLDDARRAVTWIASIALLLAVAWMSFAGIGGQGAVLSGMFVRDPMSDALDAGACVLVALALVYAWPYLRERGLAKGEVAVMMLFATLGILIYGLTLTKFLVQVLRVPTTIIVPMIMVLCTIGTFALASRLFDIWVMVGFGVLGFILRKFGFPMAPLVLGIVLGDLLEKNLRRGLVLSDGSLLPFVTRPICIVFALVTVFTILMYVPAFKAAVKAAVAAVGGRVAALLGRGARA